jgi:hydroxypyruvate isomerase
VKLLKDLGYSQLVGFEFAPLGDDLKALEEALNALS